MKLQNGIVDVGISDGFVSHIFKNTLDIKILCLYVLILINIICMHACTLINIISTVRSRTTNFLLEELFVLVA